MTNILVMKKAEPEGSPDEKEKTFWWVEIEEIHPELAPGSGHVTVATGYHYEPALGMAIPNGYHYDPHLGAVIAPAQPTMVVEMTSHPTTEGGGTTSVGVGSGLDAAGAAAVDRTSSGRPDAAGSGSTVTGPGAETVAVGPLWEHIGLPTTGWLHLGRTVLVRPTNTGTTAIILVSLDQDGGESDYVMLLPGESLSGYQVTEGAVTIAASAIYARGSGPQPGDVSELTYQLELI